MGGHSPLRGWPDARDCACVHVVNLSITLSKNLAISVPSSDWFSTQCFLAIASAGPSTAIISLCYPYPFVIELPSMHPARDILISRRQVVCSETCAVGTLMIGSQTVVREQQGTH